MLKQKVYFIAASFIWGLLLMGSIYATNVFFTGDEWLTIAVLCMGLLSVLFLPELLTVWFLVLSSIILVFIMVFGVSYIPVAERFFFLLLHGTFTLLSLSLYRRLYQLLLGNEFTAAKGLYDQLSDSDNLRVLMVSWAHYDQFIEADPKECRHVLSVIERKLVGHDGIRQVFILDKGSFLVFAEDTIQNCDANSVSLKEKLEAIPFEHFGQQKAIQFQIAEERFSHVKANQMDFSDVVKRLGRKLETEIVVEY